MKVYRIISIIFALAAAFFTYNGANRLTKYENSEYGDSINAWVGGDAYNFIINGTHSTAFFVLAMGFLIVATLFEILYFISKSQENQSVKIELPPIPQNELEHRRSIIDALNESKS